MVYTLKAPNPTSSKTKTASATSTLQSVVRTTIVQTATPTSDPRDSTVKSSTPAIVGGTVGGVSFIGFLFLGVFCVYKRRDRPTVPNSAVAALGEKKDDASSGKDNAAVQIIPQTGPAEAEGTEGNRYTEVDSRAVNITPPQLAYPEDDGMPQPMDVTLPQRPYPENDSMPGPDRQHAMRRGIVGNYSTEADSNPILHADSNPILHADSNPILQADSNPILQADSNPILQADSNPIHEAPNDNGVRLRDMAPARPPAHELQ